MTCPEPHRPPGVWARALPSHLTAAQECQRSVREGYRPARKKGLTLPHLHLTLAYVQVGCQQGEPASARPVTFPLRHLLPALPGRQMCVSERQWEASSGLPQLRCPSRRREKLGLHTPGLSVQPPGAIGLWGSQPLCQEPLPSTAHCPTP